MSLAKHLNISLELPFPNKRIAEVVYDVLKVDEEPRRSGVCKVLAIQDSVIKANFSAPLKRQLRVALNNFFEKVDLITETIEIIGPPTSDTYNHN